MPPSLILKADLVALMERWGSGEVSTHAMSLWCCNNYAPAEQCPDPSVPAWQQAAIQEILRAFEWHAHDQTVTAKRENWHLALAFLNCSEADFEQARHAFLQDCAGARGDSSGGDTNVNVEQSSEDLWAMLEAVHDEQTFIDFLDALGRDFALERQRELTPEAHSAGTRGWQHGSINGLLGAAAACARDGEPASVEVNAWQRCAEILLRGKTYE